MSIHDLKWNDIDKKTKKIVLNNVVFVKPTDSENYPIDCPECKQLLSSIEDCECIKKHNLCEECWSNKSFNYKGNI